MISFVRGAVVRAGVDVLVVDLGAVGVMVQCTPATAASVRTGEHVELLTTMVVREDGWTLFGFVDEAERTVFEQVQTVSGIGPRIALALLATLSEKSEATARRIEQAMTDLERQISWVTRASVATLEKRRDDYTALMQQVPAITQLVLIDELSLGLAPVIVDRLTQVIREVFQQRHMGLLLVEQDVHIGLDVGSRGYCLETGHISMEGTCDFLRASEHIRRAYLGI